MTAWEHRVEGIKERLRNASGPATSDANQEDTHEDRWDGSILLGGGWWYADTDYDNERNDAVFLTHAYDDVADLLSENERISTVTDEMVEATLEALLNDMTAREFDELSGPYVSDEFDGWRTIDGYFDMRSAVRSALEKVMEG